MNAIVALAGAALMSLTFTLSAQAQSSTPTGDDATRLQIAREILAANGGKQAMEARMRSVFGAIADLSASSMPKTDSRSAELANSLMKYMVDEEVKALPEIIDQTAKAYADNLTEQELRDMLVWCASPSGQAVSKKTIAISHELVEQQAPLMKRMMAGAVSKAVDRACNDVKCTEDDRKTIIAIAQVGSFVLEIAERNCRLHSLTLRPSSRSEHNEVERRPGTQRAVAGEGGAGSRICTPLRFVACGMAAEI